MVATRTHLEDCRSNQSVKADAVVGSDRRGFDGGKLINDGLGLLPGSVCPHYDSEPGRRFSCQAAVAAGALPAGWALEDGVGALFTDGLLAETVIRTPQAHLFQVEPDGENGVTERALPCRLLPEAR